MFSLVTVSDELPPWYVSFHVSVIQALAPIVSLNGLLDIPGIREIFYRDLERFACVPCNCPDLAFRLLRYPREGSSSLLPGRIGNNS